MAFMDHNAHRSGLAGDIEADILATVNDYWRQAQQRFPAKLKSKTLPPVRFDLTGASAGQVQFSRRPWKTEPAAIRFNLHIARHNRDSIRQTVAHEIAHAVAVMVHGRKAMGHGTDWRQLMDHFGQPATRCHDYDLSQVRVRRQRRFIYHCACPDPQLLSTVRHNRQQHGRQRYVCRRCHTPLHFSGHEKTINQPA